MNTQEPQPAARSSTLAHVPELDGIRGIAALAVFCHHVLYTSISHPEQWNWAVRAAYSMSRFGLWGVDLFFVLSGYLITSTLLLDRGRSHYFWNFYWKRVLRIFPLYAVSLVCLAVFFPGSRRYALLAALFVANFAQVFHVSSAGPYWTLAIEEQFYLIWPQFTRRLTLDRLRKTALGIVAAGLALRLVAAMFGHHDYLFTFLNSDGLALGALLACQKMGREDGTRRNGGKVWGLAAAGGVLAALPYLLPSAIAPAEGKLALAAGAFQLSGVSLLGYCAVAGALHGSGARAMGVLRSRVLTFFGLISYCFYMAHTYVLRLYDHVCGPLAAGDMAHYAARFFAVLGATVALCLVSRYLIELPAMSVRRHVLRGTDGAKQNAEENG